MGLKGECMRYGPTLEIQQYYSQNAKIMRGSSFKLCCLVMFRVHRIINLVLRIHVLKASICKCGLCSIHTEKHCNRKTLEIGQNQSKQCQVILQYVTSATLVQSSKSAYYLVIPLTQEFQSLGSLVHKNSIQVTRFYRTNLYGFLTPAHNLIRMNIG